MQKERKEINPYLGPPVGHWDDVGKYERARGEGRH
jgi:hypothetical protein